MSSLAQEESRSISENVTWGQRKRMADVKVSLPYGQFLGYEKGEDGLPKIVESEAEIVRMIFRLFIEGNPPSAIAKHLASQGIPSPAGKKTWQVATMGTQKKIAEKIVEKEADYVLALKGNHGTFSNEVKKYFEDALESEFKDIKYSKN